MRIERNFLNLFFKISTAFFILAFFFQLTASAAPLNKVTYFRQQVIDERGEKLLRVEIGVSRSSVNYVVKNDSVLRPDRLTVEIERTGRGNLRREISLNGEFAKSIEVSEEGGRNLRLVFTLSKSANEQECRVYTLPEDRRTGKPYRIVVDISGDVKKERKTGLNNRTVILDAGHGGSDTGAVGIGGLREKDVTLSVAKKVRDILKEKGVKVVMTREDDRDVYGPNATDVQELQARVNYGFANPDADIFVSIHCDAFTDSAANGTGTFYYPKTWMDANLARSIQNAITIRGERRDRGIKEARFYVCRHSMIPAALVELAFITNYIEGHLLASDDFRNEIALGIAEGIENYFKGI